LLQLFAGIEPPSQQGKVPVSSQAKIRNILVAPSQSHDRLDLGQKYQVSRQAERKNERSGGEPGPCKHCMLDFKIT
jgi:hypothetical protein